jgi:ferredoxin
MHKNATIYYFSGTGNALTVGRWIAEKARQRSIQADLIAIDRFRKIEVPKAGGRRLLGFCYPTHGFGIPWFMLKFILRFPVRERCDVFLVNTRAGSKIGRLFLPGVSGIAQLLPALILLVKGFRLRGLFPADLPSNWTSVHPGYNNAAVEALFSRSRAMADRFCDRILDGRGYVRPNVLVMLPVDLLLAPISLLYFVYGRFWLAKLFFASSDCDGCGLCAEKCPTGSIRLHGGRPFWKFSCESCMRCLNVCPRKAIQVSHLLAVLIGVGGSYLPLGLVYKAIDPALPAALYGPVKFAVNWGLYLSFIFLVSALAWWLIRLKLFNHLLTYTSLTKFWRHYIAPGVGAKDFKRVD